MTGFFRGEVAKNNAAGYVLLVARDGKLAYSSAVGLRNRERQLPMTIDTRFRIASMTKPVTSVGVLMLYEEGRLHLDDPVSRFLPEFANARVYTGKDASGAATTVPAAQPITIRHLLTHTAGSGTAPGSTVLPTWQDLGQPRPLQSGHARGQGSRDRRAAAVLQSRRAVALQLCRRRAGPCHRSDLRRALRAVPAQAAVRAARHASHGLLDGRGR